MAEGDESLTSDNAVNVLQVADLRDNPELRPFVLSNVTPTGTKIGFGAYGSVKEVAICGAAKEICSLIPDDDFSRASTQFVKECQLMSTLHHPNIVQFLGVYFFEGSRLPILVMERLLTSLHDLLDPKIQPPPGTPRPLSFFKLCIKCSVLHDVASGLAYLHGRTPPIIHRGLSAKRVLLTSQLAAKLDDLGVARIQKGAVSETTVYMPPEVTEPTESNDEKSKCYFRSIDVFSLGVVTIFTVGEIFPREPIPASYTNVTGKLEARTELQRRSTYVNNVKAQLRACGQFHEDHPLIRLIQQCLDNTPAKRPSISEVLGLLEEARASITDENNKKNRLELVRALQNLPRNQNLIKNLVTENAELQKQHQSSTQQLMKKEAELTWAKETIRRQQQQIIELRQQGTEKDALAQDRNIAQVRQQLTVQCQKKSRAPWEMSRGSATTDDQFAYFTTQGFHSVYRYEFSTEKWEELPPSPHYDSGLAIIDGQLTTVGGHDAYGWTNKLITLRQGLWVEHYPPMNTARCNTAVVSTSDGNYIVVIGGSVDYWTTTVELFHVKSRIWYTLTDIPEALTQPSATICGNELHVIGGKGNGYSCFLQAFPSSDQPSAISWTKLPEQPVILSTAATLCGHLLIIGGDRSKDQSMISKLFSVDPDVNRIYQLVGQQWVKIGTMSVTRSECLVVSLSSEEILIVGGVEEKSVETCFVLSKY